MSSSEHDYLIVGGGSAGSVLAGRLSEQQHTSVALLEAGGTGDSQLVKTPAAGAAMLPTRINNYALETVPQMGLGGRRGYQPRGKGLGGSSAINAMVYIRGHRSDYDHWAALGNPGWSYAELLPYFLRSEDNASLKDVFHGQGGPLPVADLRTGNPFHKAYLDAARQTGFAVTRDFNGAEQEGVGIYQVTQRNGERWSAARAYLHPHIGNRPNLQVVTGAQATRILFEGRRAVGVVCTHGGQEKIYRARKEVILSAGAFHTPQLLMVSGVGPAQHLSQVGVKVLHDLPGVGQN